VGIVLLVIVVITSGTMMSSPGDAQKRIEEIEPNNVIDYFTLEQVTEELKKTYPSP